MTVCTACGRPFVRRSKWSKRTRCEPCRLIFVNARLATLHTEGERMALHRWRQQETGAAWRGAGR